MCTMVGVRGDILRQETLNKYLLINIRNRIALQYVTLFTINTLEVNII